MSKFSTIKEIFELYFNRRKFYMFPIVILLIALIGVVHTNNLGNKIIAERIYREVINNKII